MKHTGGKLLKILAVLTALLCIALAGWSSAETMETMETTFQAPGSFSAEDAAEQYIYRQLGWDRMIREPVSLKKGSTAGSGLNGVPKVLYDALKLKVQAVAAGELESTEFVFSMKTLFSKGCSAEALGVTGLDFDTVAGALLKHMKTAIRALQADYPYDFYWYDKVTGSKMSASGTDATSDPIIFGDNFKITVSCTVSKDYSKSGAGGTYVFNTNIPTKVKTAAATAKKIVANCAGQSDYFKLCSYKATICSLTDYNYDAAGNDTTPYGDPWQLIWVFDGDPDTKVVCEGYSKAFQYLSDLSTFSAGTKVISVTGDMTVGNEGGGHMWNVVTLGGLRYIADVTNSDTNSIGRKGELFLTKYKTHPSTKVYTYEVSGEIIKYTYDNDTLSNFAQDNYAELALAEDSYTGIEIQGPFPDFQAYWILYKSGVLSIVGTGAIPPKQSGDPLEWQGIATYNSMIQSIIIEDGITGIGANVFNGCSNVTSLFLPDSLTTIGDYAFSGCSHLSSVIIPNGVTTIGSNAFEKCGALTTVIIPKSVTSIGNGVFHNSNNLQNVYFCGTREEWNALAVALPTADILKLHNFSEVTYTWADDNSTVTAAGTCSICGDTVTETATSTIDEASTTATCTTGGETTYTAAFTTNPSFTTQTKTVQSDPLGHNLTEHPAVPATCTTAGSSAYWSCERCGEYFSDAAGTTSIEENSWIIQALGHNLTPHSAVPATCTTAGNSAYWSCDGCGGYFSDAAGNTPVEANSWVIAATGHTLTAHPAAAATCTAAGSSAYWSCERCGEYFSDAAGTTSIEEDSWVIQALGHNLTEHPAVPATCTTAGNSAYWSCDGCGGYFSDAEGTTSITENSWVIAATGHNMTHHDAQAATCTAKGNIEYWTCSLCNGVFSDDSGQTAITMADTETPKIAHTPGTAVQENRNEATCTATGSYDEVVYCTGCGGVISRETKTIPMAAHTLGHHAAVAHTCYENGNTEYWQCTVCSKCFSDEGAQTEITASQTVDPASHTLEYREPLESTCTFAGWVEHYHCTACGKDFSDNTGTQEIDKTIPAKGHQPAEAVEENRTEATCTTAGYYEMVVYCSACTTQLDRKGYTIAALGHDPQPVDEVPAGCTTPGVAAHWKCSRCDQLFSDAEGQNKIDAASVIPALGHDLVHHDAKAPTCTAIGWEAYDTCSRCDYTTYAEKEALGHDIVNHPAQAPTCEEAGWNAYDTCSRCDYTTKTEIAALGHNWHADYSWKEDCSQCTANVVCQRNQAHQNTETVDTQSAVSTQPTCEGKGKTTYTAIFTIEGAEEQTTTLENIDPLDHDWGGPVYTWSADNRTVTAEIICKRDRNHKKDSETVNVTSRVSKAATCTEKGQTTYTSAAFVHPEYTVQTKTLTDVPALGHQLTAHGRIAPTYDSTGTEAYWECTRCHKLFADAAGTKVISAPVVIAKLVRPAEPAPAPAPTEPPEPADKVAAFVTRCYRVILGREPEQAGLDYWVENLKSGKEKASEIINGFVTSQEFRNKHLTDEDAVEILYKAMLGRASDEGGKNYWLSVLNGGNPFAAVINGFCTSKEFNNLCASYGIQPGSVKTGPLKPPKPVKNMAKIRAFVTRCYQVILSRDPEAEGLEYWAKALASGEKEAAEIIDGFVNSREYTNKRLGYADSVEVLYNAMLGRGSDADGKVYWIRQLEAGKPFAAIINGFCTSKEFKNLCDQYGITPGSVKTSDKVKGTFTAATSKTRPAKETKQISEAKLADFVRRIYAAALGREPGDGEAEYWVWQLKELRIAPADAAKGILTSGEFRSRGIGGEQLIRILYRVYADRDADEAGLAFWLAKLEAGASPEELMDDFAASAEFKNILRTFWE